MKNTKLTKIGKSKKYKCVTEFIHKERGRIWMATFNLNQKTNTKFYPSEREAALAVDKFKIQY